MVFVCVCSWYSLCVCGVVYIYVCISMCVSMCVCGHVYVCLHVCVFDKQHIEVLHLGSVKSDLLVNKYISKYIDIYI